MIDVQSNLYVYEGNSEKIITIKSHWNEPSKVVLNVNGIDFVLVAKDLRAAIDNAVNSAK